MISQITSGEISLYTSEESKIRWLSMTRLISRKEFAEFVNSGFVSESIFKVYCWLRDTFKYESDEELTQQFDLVKTHKTPSLEPVYASALIDEIKHRALLNS